jgi:hypothetical protein
LAYELGVLALNIIIVPIPTSRMTLSSSQKSTWEKLILVCTMSFSERFLRAIERLRYALL